MSKNFFHGNHIFYNKFKVEPKREPRNARVPGDPREREGVGLKILSAGRESRKESAFPQISYSSHYLQVLTKNFDLNLTQILEIKSIQYLKTSI